MICWVKSFGILYFLLGIGDPAEGLRASQKTACKAGQIHHGAVARGIANVVHALIAGRLGACQPARFHAWLAKTTATGTVESEEQPH
jgi:hypothetical protein